MAKTTAEKIKVMQAYDNDYEIESKCIAFDDIHDEWKVEKNPNWNWAVYDFRIKKESTKRPMTLEEIRQYWKEHRTEIFYYLKNGVYKLEKYFMITGFRTETFSDGSVVDSIMVDNSCIGYKDFITYVTKEDGTKFEVEE